MAGSAPASPFSSALLTKAGSGAGDGSAAAEAVPLRLQAELAFIDVLLPEAARTSLLGYLFVNLRLATEVRGSGRRGPDVPRS
jgi:hypothetical protein